VAELSYAERLLKSYGITEPEEIDLEAIAYDQGVTVTYRRLDGCEARIVGKGNRAIVSIDPRPLETRKRFSLAHELSHWLADRGNVSFLCKKTDIGLSGSTVRDPREASANSLAAQILMPEYLFRPLCAKKIPTFDTVDELRARFNTGLTTTAIRLIDVGRYPAMVLCYGSKGRKWFYRVRDLPESLWPVRQLDEESQAFGLLRGEISKDRPTTQSADTWIDHADASDYSVIEHSRKVANETVVTLLWWKDERQIRDLES